MKFQKGHAMIPGAGRPPKSKNKKKIPKVAEFLAEKGINPAEEILKLINDTENTMSNGAKIAAWQDLMSYCQAKPRDVEKDDDNENESDPFDSLTDDELLRLVKNPPEAV